jgi:hypothetical protein
VSCSCSALYTNRKHEQMFVVMLCAMLRSMTMTEAERRASARAADARYRASVKGRASRLRNRPDRETSARRQATYKATAKGAAWWYAYNRSAKRRAAGARYSAERKQRFKKWLRSLKREGCLDCGRYKRQPDRLEFHHRDPSTKLMNVPIMSSYSQERVMVEIAKCDVLCGDCHRKRHAR